LLLFLRTLHPGKHRQRLGNGRFRCRWPATGVCYCFDSFIVSARRLGLSTNEFVTFAFDGRVIPSVHVVHGSHRECVVAGSEAAAASFKEKKRSTSSLRLPRSRSTPRADVQCTVPAYSGAASYQWRPPPPLVILGHACLRAAFRPSGPRHRFRGMRTSWCVA
jgi:hypothetical protein